MKPGPTRWKRKKYLTETFIRQAESMNSPDLAQATDIYPSRNGGPGGYLKRLDPVVYSDNPGRSPVSQELIHQYRTNGFLVLSGLFCDQEIGSFQRELARLRDATESRPGEETIVEPGSGDVRSIFMVHSINPVFAKLASDRRLAGLAEYILGDQVYVHQSRLNYKPGFHGKEFYWHSDFETWHVEDGMPRMRALSMSITLTDNYEFNGPLMLIPGSHEQYIVCPGETPANHFQQSLKKQEYGVPGAASLAGLVNRHGIRAATGAAGSVIIFDCNIMHGSNGNITPYPRSNIFLVYNAICNRVGDPFCNQPPRPEWVASRESIKPVVPTEYTWADYA